MTSPSLHAGEAASGAERLPHLLRSPSFGSSHARSSEPTRCCPTRRNAYGTKQIPQKQLTFDYVESLPACRSWPDAATCDSFNGDGLYLPSEHTAMDSSKVVDVDRLDTFPPMDSQDDDYKRPPSTESLSSLWSLGPNLPHMVVHGSPLNWDAPPIAGGVVLQKMFPVSSRGLSADVDTGGVPVTLHVYDVSRKDLIRWMNSLLLPVSLGGAFHAGVEVGGLEWSFGYNERELQPGVRCSVPRHDPMHRFRQSVRLGLTSLSAEQITATIRDLIEEYPGQRYDLLHRNCCHFADDFCQRLGVDPIPGWVHRLARAGGMLHALASGAAAAVGAAASGESHLEPQARCHPLGKFELGPENRNASQVEQQACVDSTIDSQALRDAMAACAGMLESGELRCAALQVPSSKALQDALQVAAGMCESGRACEFFPVARALSLASDGEKDLEVMLMKAQEPSNVSTGPDKGHWRRCDRRGGISPAAGGG
mmetsp:Transcript_98678/g.170864  ORF Transcript_98678/g.170864 Transcript_98678/m.170864 type:complete len:482 (-) Transcript_98678:56-1501(-)